uniref:Retrovirus-related Pol polyprotein from transposon TNT 1-94 n=1 Tax=Cajanus cajan TaxID=3821 RepID=A0A151RAY3_CAJCA|nr:Retrovirus-related Pol polyprotein from transposon TNT 1-94 [Cajanus cajan]
MSQTDWELLDRQALDVVKLTLAKNVTYNIVNEKMTYGLIKVLSNMYEKPSASNKVFLIRQLINTKIREGASVTDHVNEFNSLLSRLVSMDINFDDEVQALLFLLVSQLSLLLDSWSGIVTTIANTSGTTKLTFEGIRNLILGEDIHRRNVGESTGSLLSIEGKGRRPERGEGSRRNRSKSKKRR